MLSAQSGYVKTITNSVTGKVNNVTIGIRKMRLGLTEFRDARDTRYVLDSLSAIDTQGQPHWIHKNQWVGTISLHGPRHQHEHRTIADTMDHIKQPIYLFLL